MICHGNIIALHCCLTINHISADVTEHLMHHRLTKLLMDQPDHKVFPHAPQMVPTLVQLVLLIQHKLLCFCIYHVMSSLSFSQRERPLLFFYYFGKTYVWYTLHCTHNCLAEEISSLLIVNYTLTQQLSQEAWWSLKCDTVFIGWVCLTVSNKGHVVDRGD